MIIDAHCHFVAEWRLPGGINKGSLFSSYLQRAQKAGIHKTVLFANFAPDYGEANRAVAAIVRKWPERFVGFAFVHAERDKGRIQPLVRTAIERYGFRGIKVHRHDAAISDEVCMAAREFGVPLLYDVMDEVDVIPCLAMDYPDVPFIIPHLGSFADNAAAQQECIGHIVDFHNVFADTSGVRFFDLLAAAIQTAGEHKFVFGTDGPWLHPAIELGKIRALLLSREAEEFITGRNIVRLLAGNGRRRRSFSVTARNRPAPRSVSRERDAVAAFDR